MGSSGAHDCLSSGWGWWGSGNPTDPPDGHNCPPQRGNTKGGEGFACSKLGAGLVPMQQGHRKAGKTRENRQTAHGNVRTKPQAGVGDLNRLCKTNLPTRTKPCVIFSDPPPPPPPKLDAQAEG